MGFKFGCEGMLLDDVCVGIRFAIVGHPSWSPVFQVLIEYAATPIVLVDAMQTQQN